MYELKDLLASTEGEKVEFKEAKRNFDYTSLSKYCSALANEGGGFLVLGVTNEIPRTLVGTECYLNELDKVKHILYQNLGMRIQIDEKNIDGKRILIFDIPSRPLGLPVGYLGAYWMRAGESLVAMSPDQIKRIFEEATTDFSSELCKDLILTDLDRKAIETFRDLWTRKSGKQNLKTLSVEQLLLDAELKNPDGLTNAALILFGTYEAITKYLPQAEVIFEYRNSEASGPANQRKEFRSGIFTFIDELWTTINLRNEVQHFQDGLFIWDIPTFNEIVVREGILNALCHRDFKMASSVFIRQFPQRLEITNPGGFPQGVTIENILWQQSPRNRRLSETLTKCGVVERSGQGVNRMFEESIKESKARPDFSRSDSHQVFLRLFGTVRDARFLKFLEKIGSETSASFSTDDLLVLDYVHNDGALPDHLRERAFHLKSNGIIEATGRGRGVKFILSRKFYSFLGKAGEYTRKKGLDRETNKQLLLKHIKENGVKGCQLRELAQVLPSLSRGQLQSLLKEMSKDEQVFSRGTTNAAKWFLK